MKWTGEINTALSLTEDDAKEILSNDLEEVEKAFSEWLTSGNISTEDLYRFLKIIKMKHRNT